MIHTNRDVVNTHATYLFFLISNIISNILAEYMR